MRFSVSLCAPTSQMTQIFFVIISLVSFFRLESFLNESSVSYRKKKRKIVVPGGTGYFSLLPKFQNFHSIRVLPSNHLRFEVRISILGQQLTVGILIMNLGTLV